MALTTLADCKIFLGITDTSEDTLLNLLITQVSAGINEYLDRNLGTTTLTEYYCGNGSPNLVLNQRPVTSITSIYLDDNGYWGAVSGSFASGTLLQSGVDYALVKDQPDGSSRCGMVCNMDGWWPAPFTYSPGTISPSLGPFIGNIKVTYVAGYASVPANVELACNMAIANIRNTAQTGALTDESYEDYAYSLAEDKTRHWLTPEVRSMLARYRNVAVA